MNHPEQAEVQDQVSIGNIETFKQSKGAFTTIVIGKTMNRKAMRGGS